MKVVFLGTPEFAVPTLEALVSCPEVEVVGVVTQPDRPAGRGQRIYAPPTKLVANRFAVPVFQPTRLSKAPEVVQSIRDLKPDILITAAFGQILKKDVLTLAPYGVMNLHASLLPAYRGAAPINWCLINGESKTGVTTMFSDEGIDTGAMLLKKEINIDPSWDAELLAQHLSVLGAQLVIETLKLLKSGILKPVSQDNSLATMAPRLTKELGCIDWAQPAQTIVNLIRGLAPWPGTFTTYEDSTVKIVKARRGAAAQNVMLPGTAIKTAEGMVVACGKGDERIIVDEIQPANKGRMKGTDWLNGLRKEQEIRLGGTCKV